MGDATTAMGLPIEIVLEHFGLRVTGRIGPASHRSHFHRVFRCETDRGVVSLKILSVRPDLPAWLDRFSDTARIELRLRDCGAWYVPAPMMAASGGAIARVSPLSGGQFWAVVHEWVPGPTLEDVPPDALPGAYGAVGAAITHMAGVEVLPSASRLPTANGDLEPDRLREVMAALLARGLDAPRAAEADAMLALVEQPGVPTGIGHRDLRGANVVMASSAGGVHLIDFENAAGSCPGWEVARVLVDVWGRELPEEIECEIEDRLVTAALRGVRPTPEDFGDWLGGFVLYLEHILRTGRDAALRDAAAIFARFLHVAREREYL